MSTLPRGAFTICALSYIGPRHRYTLSFRSWPCQPLRFCLRYDYCVPIPVSQWPSYFPSHRRLLWHPQGKQNTLVVWARCAYSNGMKSDFACRETFQLSSSKPVRTRWPISTARITTSWRKQPVDVLGWSAKVQNTMELESAPLLSSIAKLQYGGNQCWLHRPHTENKTKRAAELFDQIAFFQMQPGERVSCKARKETYQKNWSRSTNSER
jgi:hypothetical protein